jgi:hypothetical protein
MDRAWWDSLVTALNHPLMGEGLSIVSSDNRHAIFTLARAAEAVPQRAAGEFTPGQNERSPFYG